MNIGILGSGFMGGTHARAFAKVAGVNVVAVSSRSKDKAQKLAEEIGDGVRADTSDKKIINDPNVDAVSITLPTHLHKKFAIAALEAGKPVLLEKPLALSVRDCDKIIEAQQRTGTLLMIGHTLRFWPEYVALVKFVHSGVLGKPLSAVAVRLSQAPPWSSWFNNPKLSGGAVLDLMIHDIDTFNWLFGKPHSLFAKGQQARPSLWNHVLATLDFGGVHGLAEGSEMMPEGYAFSMSLKVLCERGLVEYRFKAGGVSVEMRGGGSGLMVYEANNAYKLDIEAGNAYETQAAYFADCVRNKRAPEHGTAEQSRLAVLCCNAIRKSLETGKVIAVR